MYQSLQLEVMMMQYVQADLVSLEKAAEKTDFEHLVVHVRRGDETAVVKLQEQIADLVAQEPSPETGHQRTEEDCSTCSN